jgi:outer membrane protein TolC
VSNIRVQEALRDQAFVAYQETVLAAFQDVENALVALAKEQQHRQALTDAVTANRKALDLAMLLYSEGLTDFLNVLVAQNALYSSQAAAVQSDTAIATDLIALYKALGGGWDSVSPQSPTTPVVPSEGNHG